MTAHDKNLPEIPNRERDATPDLPVTHASRDRATIIVWRVTADAIHDGSGTPSVPDAAGSPLTPRLARHLVAIYSDVHGTVIDFDADPRLQQAAESSGRSYRAIGDLVDAHAEADLGEPAALIVMRWPRPATPTPGSDVNGLLSRCQRHLADDGSTIIVVTAALKGARDASYGDHERILLPAAEAAGLAHLHDIVPLDAEDGRDSFIYTTGHRGAMSTVGEDVDAVRQIAVTTLVIFGHPGRRP
ncbi:MAG: hypothetical protein QOE51_4563 [Actinoplanes sp.]|jgi:hypothetical protein|nr:hypothetical protein [Actinoplanes sp.]